MYIIEYFFLGRDICDVLEVKRGFGGTYCLHLRGKSEERASKQALLLSYCLFGSFFDPEEGSGL
jgi:hypothetical protein